MRDPATSPALEASAAWIAAYALGLAYSESSDQQRLADLLDAAGGRTALLDAAHRRLDGAEVAERAIREAALHLLERARGRVADSTGSGHASMARGTCPGDHAMGHQTTISEEGPR